MALTDLTRISTSGIATGTSLSGAILHGDAHFRGTQVGVTSALFDSSDDALEFNDNVKLKFGNSGDLSIYHNGSDNYIDGNSNAEDHLYIRANVGADHSSNIHLQAKSGEDSIVCRDDESVELHFNGNQKLRTTNHGAVVTGILTATSFSGPTLNTSGIATFYDLRVSNNLTVEGTTTTLDTNLIGVDRVEIGANSNTDTAIVGIQSGTADILNLFDGATEVLTVVDGGKVGIGVTNPSEKLRVRDLAATGTTVRSNTIADFRSNASNGDAHIRLSNGVDHSIDLGVIGDADFYTTHDGVERFRITSAGKVGIGTFSGLNYNLEVQGSGQQTILIGSQNANGALLVLDGDSNGDGAGGDYSYIAHDSSGDMLIATDNPNGNSDIVFKAGADDEKVRITSTGLIQAKTRTASERRMILAGSPSNSAFNIEAHDGATGTSSGTVQGELGLYYNDGSTLSDTATIKFERGSGAPDGAMTFFTNNAEKLRITSDAKIKVNVPTSKIGITTGSLDVWGDATSYPTLRLGSLEINEEGEHIRFGRTDISADIRYHSIWGRNSATSGSNYLAFKLHDGSGSPYTGQTEVLRLTGDGNVIIGSGGSWSYPKALNVQGSSGSILSLYNADTTSYAADTTTGIELKLLTGNTGTTSASCEIRAFKENGTNGNSARALSFYTGINGGSPNERLRIDSLGNVKIGSGDPTDILDVHRDSTTVYDATDDNAQKTHSASITVRNDNGSTNTFSQLVFDTGGSNQSIARIVAIRKGAATNDLAFVTEHSNTKAERLRITSAGNVTVGGHTAALSTYNSSQPRLSVYKSSGSGGYLELGGNIPHNGHSSGTILFINNDNSEATSNNANGKILAMQRVENVTSDTNAGDDMGGDLAFHVKPESGSLTEHLRLKSDGNVTINDGNLILAAGHGIDFSATSDASGSTSELFTDYERGVHTFSVTSGSTNPTVNIASSYNKLYYTKIGDMVHVTGELRWTISSHGSGNLHISLPFTCANDQSASSQGTAQTWNVNWAWRSESQQLFSEVQPGATYMRFRIGGSGSLNEDFLQCGSTYQKTANSGYGVEYQVSLWYRTG